MKLKSNYGQWWVKKFFPWTFFSNLREIQEICNSTSRFMIYGMHFVGIKLSNFIGKATTLTCWWWKTSLSEIVFVYCVCLYFCKSLIEVKNSSTYRANCFQVIKHQKRPFIKFISVLTWKMKSKGSVKSCLQRKQNEDHVLDVLQRSINSQFDCEMT